MTRALLTSSARKAFLAVGLVLGLGLAMPVQAADNVQFGFSFDTGNSTFGFSLGNGGFSGRHFAPPPQRVCMNEDQMRYQLRQLGYRWINFGNERRGWVHVTAQNYGRSYALDMNRCTGAIANVVAARGPRPGSLPQGGFENGWHPNGGFPANGPGWGGFRR